MKRFVATKSPSTVGRTFDLQIELFTAKGIATK